MKDEALRLALEALKTCRIDGDGWSGPHYDFDDVKVGKARAAIRQALEQPEQEPCVHAKNPKGCHRVRCQLGNKCVDDDMAFRTSPPKREWQGLTEDEIKECFKITPDLFLPWHIYKRIEAKLKEKNNE